MRLPWEVAAPASAAILGTLVLVSWLVTGRAEPTERRVPIDRPAAEASAHTDAEPIEPQWHPGPGHAGQDRGNWPQFRGPDRTGWIEPPEPLARSWGESGPRPVWKLEVGEGYAAPTVADGRVYMIDYDMDSQADALRCLSLDDGRGIWRKCYPIAFKRSRGMSRTVPAIADNTVVSIGPKCHVLAVDAQGGRLKWFINMVERFGTTVPPWYTGQCPLIDRGKVILAPAGPEVLMAAADLKTGELRWTTPNPMGWSMTHSSIVPMDLEGRRMYVYCGSGGVAGVDAESGELLWHSDQWRVPIATIASPVVVGPGLIFLSGGYNSGSMLMRIEADAEQGYETRVLWKLSADEFGATQHTPIFHRDHIFGIRPDGQLVCLDLDGRIQWASGPRARFGLGPLLIADDLIYLMDDRGRLTLVELSTEAYRPLDTARVLDGRESWGPLALAGDRLLVRDLMTIKCLDVGMP